MSTRDNPKRKVREVESRRVKQPTVRTLAGKIRDVIKQCTECLEWIPLKGFYVDSDGSHRAKCITCWDKFNGRNTKRKDVAPQGNNILEFIISEGT